MFYKLSALKNNKNVDMSSYLGKVILIVNSASKCGFTNQYKELEEIYRRIGNSKFEILAFPSNQFLNQEPGTDKEISAFCEINFGVTFSIFSKIDVKGKNIHPIYKFLTNSKPGFLGKSVKWNFTKFLIGSDGQVIDRYAPTTKPEALKSDIEQALAGK